MAKRTIVKLTTKGRERLNKPSIKIITELGLSPDVDFLVFLKSQKGKITFDQLSAGRIGRADSLNRIRRLRVKGLVSTEVVEIKNKAQRRESITLKRSRITPGRTAPRITEKRPKLS